VTAETQKLNILIRNTAKKAMHILGLKRHCKGVCILIIALWLLHARGDLESLPLSVDLVNRLLLVLGGLAAATTVLSILTAASLTRARFKGEFPASFPLDFQNVRIPFLVNKKLATLETHAPHNFHYKLEELRVVDWPCKSEMPKVAGAVVVVLTTASANLTIFKDAHAGIKQAIELALSRGRIGYLTHRTTNYLFRTEDPKLDPYNRFSFRGTR
jgi:hypothetical protein